MNKSTGIFSLAALAALLSGCALTQDNIGLNYVPQPAVAKMAGADTVKVTVRMTDDRAIRDKVGSKKNGYGMDMAPIVSTTDVVELIQGAIETELRQRGFGSGGNVVVAVDLIKFYNDFKVGFWAGDSLAEFLMNVQVKDNGGTTIFVKSVTAEGLEPNIQIAGGNNARISLEAALKRGMEILFGDKEFTSALIKAGAPPKPTPVASAVPAEPATPAVAQPKAQQ